MSVEEIAASGEAKVAAIQAVGEAKVAVVQAVQEAKEDNWKYRRAMAFFSVVSMTGILAYLAMFSSPDNAVQSMLASSIPVAIIGVVITYIGGAIADDFVQYKVSKS